MPWITSGSKREVACITGLLLAGGCGSDAAVDGGAPDGAPVANASCLPRTIADPDFMISSDWTASGPVTIVPGTATFTDRTRCEFGGVGRALPALPAACAQPLVFSLHTTYGVANPPGDTGALGVRINGGWNFLEPPRADDASLTLCLGARLFGAVGDIFLGGGTQPLGCHEPDVDLDREDLEVTGVSIGLDVTKRCPPLGTVADGDFEQGAAGWSLVNADGTAEIVEGVGAGASRAGRIATTRLCTQPSLRGSMSIPLARDVPNTALHVWSMGTDQSAVSILIGPGPGRQTVVVGTGAARESTICIPAWAQGTVQPISFRFVGTDGVCATPSIRELLIDDLSFVSDPACDASADVLDPGFEWAAQPTHTEPFWVTSGAVELRVDAASARTGAVAAVLSASGPCALPTLQGDVTIPHASGPAGPALVFWYRTDSLANARIEIGLTALSTPVQIPAAAAWTRVSACLDRRLAGRPDRLSFVLPGGGGECADTYAVTETLSIDDVELTTDPACP